jgi:antitoxin ChpS
MCYLCAIFIVRILFIEVLMIIVHIRKQGGAAIITIPSDILKMLDVQVGSILEIDVTKKGFTARPVKEVCRKRYSLAELLKGVTPKKIAALNEKTKSTREGDAVGREVS